MCGLVGVFTTDSEISDDRIERALRMMSDQIRHRGPDSSGTWVSNGIGFGHRRLAIIDLNVRASQPMHTADCRLTVAYNGEIYNFKSLRSELEGYGHNFRTECDTEVLLHGYQQWGSDLPSRLRGMFAFAIADRARRELFLARDRFGKKPLVYGWCGNTFLFASESKSILEFPGFRREANSEVIHDYLSYGYTPGKRTAFSGISRLPPAHWLLISTDDRPSSLPPPKRYWKLASVDPSKSGMTRSETAGEFLERFDEALRLRLISDVPLGVFLSGGVDSSTVVARMAGMQKVPVKTFSVGFDFEDYDETAWARQVAQRYGTEHHAFTMDSTLVETLHQAIWQYGEPFSDSSALVTMALSKEVRKFVKVALNGDGADEIFLGYPRYRRFEDEVANVLSGSGSQIAHNHFDLAFGPPTLRDRYLKYVATFRDLHKQWGYGPALMDCYLTPSADRLPSDLEDSGLKNSIDCAARADVETYLPDDLLIKTDIATMAASLEGRSPFLDHELADWAASLPQHLRVFKNDGVMEMKGLLKYAMEPQLSKDLLYRKKQGFSVPVKHWLRNEIRELTGDLLTSRAFLDRGYLRPEFVVSMLDQHFQGIEDHGTRIWNLLCLELWHRTFLDRREPGPLPSLASGANANAGLAA